MRKSALALIGLAVAATCGVAQAEMVLPPDNGLAASVPIAVLSAADADLYRQIFAAERTGRTAEADALLAKVSDQSLKGYALAEGYLSPYGSAPLSDLVDWLHSYADLPIADRVYRLAVQRASKRVHRKHHQVAIVMTASVPVPSAAPRKRSGTYEEFDSSDPPLSSPAGLSARGTIEAYIKADQPDQAAAVLRQAAANGASDYDVARLTARVSASYIAEGEDQAAYDTAVGVPGTIRQAVPTLDWYAGFAAFRLGQYENSASRLEVLAASQTVPNYLRSQAAFWAARAHLRYGDPQRVITLLTAAAHEQPTFYGVLAARTLGLDTEANFRDPVLTAADLSALMMEPGAHRALALAQLSEERNYQGEEINRAFNTSDGSHDIAYAALARRTGQPNTEMRASEAVAGRGGPLLTGLYPIPPYRPDGGYTLDPGLVLAFVRAESRFVPEAVSSAGARGLMQLMPSAAVKFGGPGATASLNDASFNMALGQRYLAFLLDQYGGNLVNVPAAYNAGTARVTGWQNARLGKEDDALTFIESIRILETRIYVKRVLMYHWMYNRRMGNASPSLDQTAAGGWPIYHPPVQPSAPVPTPRPPVNTQPPPATTVVSDARY